MYLFCEFLKVVTHILSNSKATKDEQIWAFINSINVGWNYIHTQHTLLIHVYCKTKSVIKVSVFIETKSTFVFLLLLAFGLTFWIMTADIGDYSYLWLAHWEHRIVGIWHLSWIPRLYNNNMDFLLVLFGILRWVKICPLRWNVSRNYFITFIIHFVIR